MVGSWKYRAGEFIRLKTDTLANFLKRLVIEGDIVITVYGPKGSGLSLAEDIDPNFSKENVCDSLEDFFRQMEVSYKGQKYRAIVLDDFGSELDPSEFNDVTAKMASHFFQKSRTFHNVYIITTPNRAFLNKTMRERLADYYVEVVSKDKKAGTCKIKVNRIQVNNKTGSVYYHRLFLSKGGLLNLDGEGSKVSFFFVHRPSTKLRRWYVPYRAKIGKKQLKKSSDAVLNAGDLIANTIEKIKGNPESFKRTHNKRTFWDRVVIKDHFGLTGGQARDIAILLGSVKTKKIEEKKKVKRKK
jgi:hypothetical protein